MSVQVNPVHKSIFTRLHYSITAGYIEVVGRRLPLPTSKNHTVYLIGNTILHFVHGHLKGVEDRFKDYYLSIILDFEPEHAYKIGEYLVEIGEGSPEVEESTYGIVRVSKSIKVKPEDYIVYVEFTDRRARVHVRDIGVLEVVDLNTFSTIRGRMRLVDGFRVVIPDAYEAAYRSAIIEKLQQQPIGLYYWLFYVIAYNPVILAKTAVAHLYFPLTVYFEPFSDWFDVVIPDGNPFRLLVNSNYLDSLLLTHFVKTITKSDKLDVRSILTSLSEIYSRALATPHKLLPPDYFKQDIFNLLTQQNDVAEVIVKRINNRLASILSHITLTELAAVLQLVTELERERISYEIRFGLGRGVTVNVPELRRDNDSTLYGINKVKAIVNSSELWDDARSILYEQLEIL